MCGIIGLFSHQPANQDLYDGLTVLQHRGQDAAGMVTEDDGKFYLRKSNGLVRDVFHIRHMKNLKGNIGIGHVRYPTAGSSSCAEAQPLYVNSPYGIVLAHNGNLTNSEELSKELFQTDHRHLNTNSDSEVLLNILAHELQIRNKLQLSKEDIFEAVESVHQRCRGAYAVIAAISGHGMIAFRDPNSIRPLVYGVREDKDGEKDYMFASESVALDCLGFENIVDLEPGEIVYIDEKGEKSSHVPAEPQKRTPCIFEYIYFARPDSIIDGSSVYKARVRMGEYLARRIEKEWPDHDIDVVIPVPESSRPSAMELAVQLGVKFREGFVKNRYIGRTFIMPGQEERKKSVKQKLNPISLEFEGKNVLLVDDSIVRGTTSREIIDMARQAGAKKVYFASAAPPIRYPNVYGIDMPVKDELVAHGKTEEQVREEIGADWLIYQDLDDVIEAVIPTDEDDPNRTFDCSVFDGNYVTNDIDEAYLDNLRKHRSDNAKKLVDVEMSADEVDIQEVL
ncbi:MAG: amidophosphoribosyltransferase [Pseudomonadota bacterium]